MGNKHVEINPSSGNIEVQEVGGISVIAHEFSGGEVLLQFDTKRRGALHNTYVNLAVGNSFVYTEVNAAILEWLSMRTNQELDGQIQPQMLHLIVNQEKTDVAVLDLSMTCDQIHLHADLEDDPHKAAENIAASQPINEEISAALKTLVQQIVSEADPSKVRRGEMVDEITQLVFIESDKRVEDIISNVQTKKLRKQFATGNVFPVLLNTQSGEIRFTNPRSIYARPAVSNLDRFGDENPDASVIARRLPNIIKLATASVSGDVVLSSKARAEVHNIRDYFIKQLLNTSNRIIASEKIKSNTQATAADSDCNITNSYVQEQIDNERLSNEIKYRQLLEQCEHLSAHDIYSLPLAHIPPEHLIAQMLQLDKATWLESWPVTIAGYEMQRLMHERVKGISMLVGYSLKNAAEHLSRLGQVQMQLSEELAVNNIETLAKQFNLSPNLGEEVLVSKAAQILFDDELVRLGGEYIATHSDDLSMRINGAYAVRAEVKGNFTAGAKATHDRYANVPPSSEITHSRYTEITNEINYQGSLSQFVEEIDRRKGDSNLRAAVQEFEHRVFGTNIEATAQFAKLTGANTDNVEIISAVQVAKPDINLITTRMLIDVLREQFGYPIEHKVVTLINDMYFSDTYGVKGAIVKPPIILRGKGGIPYVKVDGLELSAQLNEGMTLSKIMFKGEHHSDLADLVGVSNQAEVSVPEFHQKLMQSAGFTDKAIDIAEYNTWWITKLLESVQIQTTTTYDDALFYRIGEDGYQHRMTLADLKAASTDGSSNLDLGMVRPAGSTYYRDIPMYFGLFVDGRFALMDGLVGCDDEFDQKILDGANGIESALGSKPLVLESKWLCGVERVANSGKIRVPIRPDFVTSGLSTRDTITSAAIPMQIFDSTFRSTYYSRLAEEIQPIHGELPLNELHKVAINTLLKLF